MRDPGRLLLHVAAATVAAAGLAACSAPRPAVDATCLRAPERFETAIRSQLKVEATVENVFLREAESGTTYVSAERKLEEDDIDDSGEILTWLVVSDSPSEVTLASVDVVAREESSWPDADVTLREEDALASRACTYSARHAGDGTADQRS